MTPDDLAQTLYDAGLATSLGQERTSALGDYWASPLVLAVQIVRDIIMANGMDEAIFAASTLGEIVAYATARVRPLLEGDAWRTTLLDDIARDILRHTERTLICLERDAQSSKETTP